MMNGGSAGHDKARLQHSKFRDEVQAQNGCRQGGQGQEREQDNPEPASLSGLYASPIIRHHTILMINAGSRNFPNTTLRPRVAGVEVEACVRLASDRIHEQLLTRQSLQTVHV